MKQTDFLSLQISNAQRGALEFLYSHLPRSDLDSYSVPMFLSFIDHALALRASAPWCAELDEEIFLHYVLFPRVNDEDLSFHREIFRAALWDRIAHLPTTEEKVLEVNRWCCEMASYEMQDDRTASPLTVWRSGSGRCGEESAFLVAALRSVGIPARQVYSPRWAHCDDNHAWVEALCGRTWRFLGACEPEPIPDRGWFNSPASRALLVHSRLFGEGSHPLHGEIIGQENCVRWYNQTARYALTRRYRFRAEENGVAVSGAEISVQVLNEASFHTIATMTADRNGEASIELGIGDFHVLARLGNKWAEYDVRGEEMIALQLVPLSNGDTPWQAVDYIAPIDHPVNPASLNAEQKKERKKVLDACAEIRKERIRTADTGEIAAFLAIDDDPRRRKMVETLSQKDHRDVTAEILRAHFDHLPAQGEMTDELYCPYVACPRIELEPLTAWREPLKKALAENDVHEPEDVFALLERDFFALEKNTYANLVTTPAEAWKMRSCSARSERILTVAMLRTLGIPSRLRDFDGEVEFFRDGGWRTRCTESCGIITVHGKGAKYRQTWTLSRREENGWKRMELNDGTAWELPVGQYRATTSVRMPNGNQLAAWREIALNAGERKDIDLFLRQYSLGDMLCSRSLEKMSAVTLAEERIEDICRVNGKPSLLLWLEEGGEPTEHILLELITASEAFRELSVNIMFLLRSADSLHHRTLLEAAEKLNAMCLLPEDWAFDLEQVARHLTCDPDTPPLAVVCDSEGNAVYGDSGYRVGAVDLLRRIAGYVVESKNNIL